ncbi:MAG TPA: hypothetical protein VN238_03345 [Solirubrobacteraceae bacterium]|nr:hypothetical protein [Solirubrobacteraceae bacterium]
MSAPGHFGAYGFRIVPSDERLALPGLVPVPADAERVSVTWESGPVEEDVIDVTPARARLSVKGMVAIALTETDPELHIRVPGALQPEAVVHPILTTPLAILARWRGRAALHAGAVLHEGAAVAVCGQQGAGKSTAMASLAARGLPVVTDDLVVLEHGDVLSGPSCIDLRADTAERFPRAEYLGVVGARERHRLMTAPAPARVPLAGIFLLEWATEDDDEPLRAEPLALPERIALIHAYDYAGLVGLPRGEALLDLVELPMWRLVRPRDWAAGDAALDLLLSVAAASRPAATPPA